MPDQQLKDGRKQNIQSQLGRTRRSQYQDQITQLLLILRSFPTIVLLAPFGIFVILLLLSFFVAVITYSNKLDTSSIQYLAPIILMLTAAGFMLGWFCAGKIFKTNRRTARPRYHQTSYRPSPLISTTNGSSVIRLRITEEPLTAQNFSTIISALTELHTKCWLISKGRFSDVIEFSQTHNIRFPEQAHMVITKITQNSPVDMKLNVNADASAQGILEALKIGIDAVSQAPLRHKEMQLANQAKVLEMKLQELLTQSELDDKRQTRQINAQRTQLELERQKLEIDRQNLALQKERLEYQIAARDFAFETATMMIEKLYPEVDNSSKAMLKRTLIPELLQLSNGKGLELALPAPQVKEDEPTEDQ